MRQYSRARKQAVRTGDPTMLGGARAKRALQAQVDEVWERWHRQCERWRLTRNHSRAQLRGHPRAFWKANNGLHTLIAQATSARPGFQFRRSRSWHMGSELNWFSVMRQHEAARRKLHRSRSSEAVHGISARRWHAQQAAVPKLSLSAAAMETKRDRAEWRKVLRHERKQKEAAALSAAREVVSVAARLAEGPIECAACGEEEACMMHLPCRHVALCQRCFDATWQTNAPCTRCGHGEQHLLVRAQAVTSRGGCLVTRL